VSLSPGARLGVYEVTSLIGAGGMGEVYHARDTKLGRDVALKLLPAPFANDPERLARFQREAHVLASLNHPHIAAIYGLEETNGLTALVLELVDGPTLADRIAHGAIPVDEALPIAKQIAEALETAHEHGIVHRDLKPANIKVREDGTVKVLDFGLAKGLESTDGNDHRASLANSPTITSPAMMTGVGMILGTAAYMSPEQAKGKPADKRSDIWAFGCVLYEMLTGVRAFDGEDITDVLGAVVRLEPSWQALPSDVSPALRTLLQSCLVKDRRHRVADISTALFILEKAASLAAPAVTPSITPPPTRPVWRRALPLLGALTVGILVTLLAQRMPPVPAAPASRFTLTMPQGAPFRSPNSPGIAVSPDGSRILYRSTPGGTPISTEGQLYLRPMGQFDAAVVRGANAAANPVFSRDGEWIVYEDGREGVLKRISALGGTPTTICKLEGGRLRGASWGPDDAIVFATERSSGLFRVPAGGGTPERVTSVDAGNGEQQHWFPDVLPDGHAVLFTSWSGTLARAEVSAVSLPGGAVTHLVAGTSPHYSPSGHLLFATADSTLSAVGFDARRLRVVGNPLQIVERVGVEPSGAAHYALAGTGALTYATASSGNLRRTTLVWVDRAGHEEAINVPPRGYAYARLSPDETRIALDTRDEQSDIWIWDLAHQILQRLTNDPGMNRLPVWAPDGKRVAFSAERDGVESVYWQAFDGSGVTERLSTGTQQQTPSAFSADGSRLTFVTPLNPPYDVGVITLGATRAETMLLDAAASETNAELSPDGKWLAYDSDESGRREIWVRPFPNVESARRQVSTEGGTRPMWSRDGRELFYYLLPDTIMAVSVKLGSDLTLGSPTPVVKYPEAPVLSGRNYDVSADGKRFLLFKNAPVPDGQPAAVAEIRVILNWTEELKAKVPVQ